MGLILYEMLLPMDEHARIRRFLDLEKEVSFPKEFTQSHPDEVSGVEKHTS